MTAIEGFVVPREEVPALLDDRRRPDAVDDDWLAVARYSHAMDHVAALADDDAFRWLDRVLLDLHLLAREGLLAPELSSIEEYLGEHTADYYAVLERVQGGSYQPHRSARPWIEFCVEAHLVQARRRLQQLDAAARRWDSLEAIVEQRRWPERLVIALEQSLFGTTDRAVYGAEAEISAATATADLRRLLDADLLVQHGRGRNVHYRASDALRGRIDAG